MSEDTKPEMDAMRALADRLGLTRLYALSPEVFKNAVERGRRPIGTFPERFSQVTEPASHFSADPECGE
jgi:hypothetical protein